MKTVLAHGVFDVLHYGHLCLLREARLFGDRLVVSITTADKVNKGEGKPVHRDWQRAEMLRALNGIVDEVIISREVTPMEVINRLKPDVYVKGDEYVDNLPEEIIVKRYGGRVVFLPMVDKQKLSSSKI
jgi:D-beta-D-heptose 7-phosphate kinase/D-beta-D-heptose 1-phosphate adenosyltransferase